MDEKKNKWLALQEVPMVHWSFHWLIGDPKPVFWGTCGIATAEFWDKEIQPKLDACELFEMRCGEGFYTISHLNLAPDHYRQVYGRIGCGRFGSNRLAPEHMKIDSPTYAESYHKMDQILRLDA